MIAFLRGRLLEKAPNRLVLDVQGVGYEVHVPLSTFYVVPERGVEVSVRVHTHVREDAIALFGFGTELELAVFERLIGISGIGPRLALAVLSGIDARELVTAVRQGDVGRLTSIPGVGKKTAERIGLELRDRLPAALAGELPSSEEVPTEGHPHRDDLLSALVNLGYHRPLAENAVDEALGSSPETSLEQLLKHALRRLTR